MERIGVVGGGAWGTAVAQAAVRAGRRAVLWAREADVVAAINDRHQNERFLPGIPLAPGLRASGALADAGYDVDAYELSGALAAALDDPGARARYEAGLRPFIGLHGAPVPAEFDDLGYT